MMAGSMQTRLAQGAARDAEREWVVMRWLRSWPPPPDGCFMALVLLLVVAGGAVVIVLMRFVPSAP
jgi:hypothetical protein